MKRIIFNVKPSNRMRDGFVRALPEATFYGSTTLKSKGKSYLIPLDVYEANKEKLKIYGSKAKEQPFLNDN